mmetsp:Transcript_93212/g.237104  ORF Transcript_93212/g.237104 Transcript_93212/m.237104 type:complete len:212 (+) Transcript_93212:355-990(+)
MPCISLSSGKCSAMLSVLRAGAAFLGLGKLLNRLLSIRLAEAKPSDVAPKGACACVFAVAFSKQWCIFLARADCVVRFSLRSLPVPSRAWICRTCCASLASSSALSCHKRSASAREAAVVLASVSSLRSRARRRCSAIFSRSRVASSTAPRASPSNAATAVCSAVAAATSEAPGVPIGGGRPFAAHLILGSPPYKSMLQRGCRQQRCRRGS